MHEAIATAGDHWWSSVDAGTWIGAAMNALSILVAILVAAYISPRLARRMVRRDQQERLLRVLLNTWMTPANADYQSAIALVMVDFKGCAPVLQARADYLSVVNTPAPEEQSALQAHIKTSQEKQAALIAAISQELDFDIPAESLLSGAYVSKGFVDREALVINAMFAWQRIAAALERSNEMLASASQPVPATEEVKA